MLDFVILVLSIGEILLDFTVFRGSEDVTCTGGAVKTYFSPALLKIAKVIRLLRLLRSLRLAKVGGCLINTALIILWPAIDLHSSNSVPSLTH